MRSNQSTGHPAVEVPPGSGAIVADVAARGPLSRQAILESSGLARATVVQRLDRLFASNLLHEVERVIAGRGRPVALIDINKQCACIFVADVGETYIRLAITDLEPTILLEEVIGYRIDDNPYVTLELIASQFEAMVSKLKLTKRKVLGACIGLPAPVDFNSGMARGPSVIRSWEDEPVRDWLSERLNVPTYIENDVNLLTIAEKHRSGRNSGHFFFVKAGTGIGSGIVSHGILYRGHKGVAGDIGHIQFSSHPLHRCRCGKIGCVEARASGWALARDLRATGIEAQNSGDVLRLVENGDPDAIGMVRQAGIVLGEVIADAVSILNPDTIVIGGTLAATGEILLAGLRQAVFARALPIAAEELTIIQAQHSPQLGLTGAANLVSEMEFSPARIEATVLRLTQQRPDRQSKRERSKN